MNNAILKFAAAFVILITFVLPLESLAQTNTQAMRRFWIGYRRDDVTPQNFIKGLNEHLIPDTITVNAGKGLLAYSPVILEGYNTGDLPAEFALVTYANDAAYEAIKATPEGVAYQNEHFNFFTKENSQGLKSGSAVAVPFGSTVEFGQAYYASNGINLQDGQHSYAVMVRGAGETDADFLARAQNYVQSTIKLMTDGLADVTVRIEKNFVLEFQIWTDEKARQSHEAEIAGLRAGFTIVREGSLTGTNRLPTTAGATTVDAGDGITFDFPTGDFSGGPRMAGTPLSCFGAAKQASGK